MKKKKIFMTGGAGFIGSHACVEFLQNNYEVALFDNFSNSFREVVKRIEYLSGKRLTVFEGDICDFDFLHTTLKEFAPDSVIHFAGLKSVVESMDSPLLYYAVNVGGSLNVLRAMEKVGCKEIVFSSSASVYGSHAVPPFTELTPAHPVSIYAKSKLNVERVLEECSQSLAIKVINLRYFNPAGAHPSGLLGENPKRPANNLMPNIIRSALDRSRVVEVYGNDFCTSDGTGERDFIHISDLAVGHLKALEAIDKIDSYQTVNLGAGRPVSVKSLIETFERVNNLKINYKVFGRRSGDVARSFADVTLAEKLLDFRCVKSVEDICIDSWNWIKNNPNGYVDEL